MYLNIKTVIEILHHCHFRAMAQTTSVVARSRHSSPKFMIVIRILLYDIMAITPTHFHPRNKTLNLSEARSILNSLAGRLSDLDLGTRLNNDSS
jgi:hypothetical protein